MLQVEAGVEAIAAVRQYQRAAAGLDQPRGIAEFADEAAIGAGRARTDVEILQDIDGEAVGGVDSVQQADRRAAEGEDAAGAERQIVAEN